MGNHLQQIIDGNTTIYTYDDANRLDTVDGTSYSFDNNGNLLDSGDMLNTWDAANRLVQSQRNAATVQPIYNGVNDRVGQVVDGGTQTDFALDVQGLPEVIYSSDGNTYLHLPGVTVTENSSGEVRYLHSDHLGSTTLVTCGNNCADSKQPGDEVGRVQYGPYGKILDNTLPENLIDRLFTGQRSESSTGLYDYRARFYDPLTGSFIQPDSIVPNPMDPRAWNRFGYVYGNPVNYTDSSGHCIDGLTTLGCIAGAALIGGALNVGVNWYSNGNNYTSREAAADFLIGASIGAAGYGLGVALTPQFWGVTAGARYFTIGRTASLSLLNVYESAATAAIHGEDFTQNDLVSAAIWGAGGSLAGDLFGKLGNKIYQSSKIKRLTAKLDWSLVVSSNRAKYLGMLSSPGSLKPKNLANLGNQIGLLESWAKQESRKMHLQQRIISTSIYLGITGVPDTEIWSQVYSFEPIRNPKVLIPGRP